MGHSRVSVCSHDDEIGLLLFRDPNDLRRTTAPLDADRDSPTGQREGGREFAKGLLRTLDELVLDLPRRHWSEGEVGGGNDGFDDIDDDERRTAGLRDGGCELKRPHRYFGQVDRADDSSPLQHGILRLN